MSRTFGQLRFAFILMLKNLSGEFGFICLCRFSATLSALRFIRKANSFFGKHLRCSRFFISSVNKYGWVKLYRAKPGEKSRITLWVDAAAIYLATIYPLVFWMTKLPRKFDWFVSGDFFALPVNVEKILFPVYVLSLILYFGKSIYLYFTKGFLNIGKDIIVLTTVICWYVGIVALDSDYAFTVTNVIIHGVPYFALIYFYAKPRRESANKFYKSISRNWIVFLATLWALAYLEELFWDKSIWHERSWLFGNYWDAKNLQTYLVPLLAVPQLTHYILDGFIWRRKNNANFRLID